jgi:hypothetical protein
MVLSADHEKLELGERRTPDPSTTDALHIDGNERTRVDTTPDLVPRLPRLGRLETCFSKTTSRLVPPLDEPVVQ